MSAHVFFFFLISLIIHLAQSRIGLSQSVVLYGWYCRILSSSVMLKTQKNRGRGPSAVSPVVENGDSFETTSIHSSYLKDGSVQ